MKINIVFDGPPGPESGRFVEVEDETGKSIRLGRWVDRDDGFWNLELCIPESIEHVSVNDGDLIIVKAKESLAYDNAKLITHNTEKIFAQSGKRVGVLLVPNGLTMETMCCEDATRLLKDIMEKKGKSECES